MADFLTSMTQRTLGLLPVVQPIIASKYVSEAMGGAAPGALTLLAPFPGQMAGELSEYWEEPTDQLAPAAPPQPLLSRGLPTPSPAVHSASPPVVSSAPQPSTAPVQPAPTLQVKPRAPSAREMTGGNAPSPLVPQPRPSPVRSESLPRDSSPPADNRLPAHKDAPATADESREMASSQPESSASSEGQPFSTASESAPVSTTKPRRGQLKPSASSQQPMSSVPLTPSHTSEESNFESALPGSVPSSLPMPASTSSNPPINRWNITPIGPKGAETALVPQQGQPEPEARQREPGRGQAQPLQYTRNDGLVPSRIEVVEQGEPGRGGRSGEARPVQYARDDGLVPSRIEAVEQGGPGRGQARPLQYTRGDGTALVPPIANPNGVEAAEQGEPGRGQARPVPYTRNDALVPSGAGRGQARPLQYTRDDGPAYRPGQSRGVVTSVAEKRAGARVSENPAAPTIRVTIGRIDVRAVAPASTAAPAPVRTKRVPALSLEDYLKQRNGRKL